MEALALGSHLILQICFCSGDLKFHFPKNLNISFQD